MTHDKAIRQELETRINRAIKDTPGLDRVPEIDYCRIVTDVLSLVATGIEMRLCELEDEER